MIGICFGAHKLLNRVRTRPGEPDIWFEIFLGRCSTPNMSGRHVRRAPRLPSRYDAVWLDRKTIFALRSRGTEGRTLPRVLSELHRCRPPAHQQDRLWTRDEETPAHCDGFPKNCKWFPRGSGVTNPTSLTKTLLGVSFFDNKPLDLGGTCRVGHRLIYRIAIIERRLQIGHQIGFGGLAE